MTVAGTEDEGTWSRGLGPALDPAVAICCCLLPPSSGGCDVKTSVGMAELNDAVANWLCWDGCGADGGSAVVGAAAAAVGMGIESAPGPGVLRIELPELKPEAKELVASTLALSDKDDSSA